MSFSDSYYDDSYEYEFNPYDSDSWPEVNSSSNLDDESQKPHHDQLHEGHSAPPSIPLPQVNITDPSVAVCYSLDQSKQLIQERFGVSPSALRSISIPGIVVIPLKDINLIRKDTRHNRILPHIMVFPAGENFQLIHKDFAQSIQLLNQ